MVAGAALAYAQPDSAAAEQAVINKYCVVCHNTKLHTGGLSLQDADLNNVPASAETWEKVHSQAAHRLDAAAGHAAAGRSHAQRPGGLS